jgi:hypothetical protein
VELSFVCLAPIDAGLVCLHRRPLDHLPAAIGRHGPFAVNNGQHWQKVNGLASTGLQRVGELERYEDSYRLCYVRGPEGIIVALAEPLS